MSNTYRWAPQLALGAKGLRLVSALLRVRGFFVRDVSDIPDEQARDVDLYVQPPESSRWMTVEVKTDTYTSGNLFLELSSSSGKPGCVYKSRAQWWAYWLKGLEVLLLIDLPALQLWLLDHQAEYERKRVHSIRGRSGWSVEGLLVPYEELVAAGVAKRIHLAC